MPLANLILILLIGLVLGVFASVILKSRGGVFIVNILLGVMGASLGAFSPLFISNAVALDVSTPNYLLRALIGAFVLVFVACLFRPATTRHYQ